MSSDGLVRGGRRAAGLVATSSGRPVTTTHRGAATWRRSRNESSRLLGWSFPPSQGARRLARGAERGVRAAESVSVSVSCSDVDEIVGEVEAAFDFHRVEGGRSSLAVRDGTLCLVANQSAEEGDLLLRIPIDQTLSEESFEDIFPQGSDPSLENLETWMKLVLALTEVRRNGGAESGWRPFLMALDSKYFRKHPLLWRKEELLELEGTQTFEKLRSYNDYLEGVWQQMVEFVLPVLQLEGKVAREDFFWAFGVLKTMALRPFSQPQSLRIVPLMNLLTHGRRTNCNTKFASSGIFKKDETLDLLATRRVEEGDVLVYDFDPDKSEIDVLVDFGCFDESHPRRGMALTLAIDESDENYDDKCDVVEEVARLRVSQSFEVSEEEPPPEDMLAFLRLIQLKDADAFILESIFRNDVWDFMSNPVSKDNERNICEAMEEWCLTRMEESRTTIERDAEILATLSGAEGASDPTTQRRMGIQARVLEKRTLRGLLNYFRSERAQLGAKEYYHERRLKSLGLLDMDGNSTY